MSKLAFKCQMQMFVSIQMSNANANVSLHMAFKCQMQMFVIPFKCKCKCFTKHLQMYLIWIQMFLNICKKNMSLDMLQEWQFIYMIPWNEAVFENVIIHLKTFDYAFEFSNVWYWHLNVKCKCLRKHLNVKCKWIGNLTKHLNVHLNVKCSNVNANTNVSNSVRENHQRERVNTHTVLL